MLGEGRVFTLSYADDMMLIAEEEDEKYVRKIGKVH